MRFSLALMVSASLFAQQKGGNNLIRPLADLEKDLKGKLERIKVHGKSLEGNLEGDSADRDVFVYLPPSYQREPNRRYPVVYTLHGYGLHAVAMGGLRELRRTRKGRRSGHGPGDDPRESRRLLAAQRQLLFEFAGHRRLGDFPRRRVGRIYRQSLPHFGQSSQPRSGGTLDGRLWDVSTGYETPGSVLQPVFDVGLLHARRGRSHTGHDPTRVDDQDQEKTRPKFRLRRSPLSPAPPHGRPIPRILRCSSTCR